MLIAATTMTYKHLFIGLLILGFYSLSFQSPALWDDPKAPPLQIALNGVLLDLGKSLPCDAQGILDISISDEDKLLKAGCKSPGYSIFLVRGSKPVNPPLIYPDQQALSQVRLEQLLKRALPGDRLMIEVLNLKRRLFVNLQLS